jgi:hypothetical protein
MHIYINEISLINRPGLSVHKCTHKDHHSIPPYHLHTANDEQMYKGKHVELIVSQGGINGNSILHFKTGKLPSSTMTFTGDLTARCATRPTRNTTRLTSTLTLAHKITPPT